MKKEIEREKKGGQSHSRIFTFSTRRYIEINQYHSTRLDYQNIWRELVYIACEVPDGTGGNKKRREEKKISISERHLPPGFRILLDGLREINMRRTRFLDLALMTVMRFDDDATRNASAKNRT